MIVDENFIREFVKENLWQLDKTNLQSLANSMNIEFKKSETKDSLLNKIKTDNAFDLLDIYDKFKKWCFGIYPTKAQEILNIDNKTLKKLAKKDFIKVAYTREQKLYGSYIDVPYYLLESFMISENELNIAIEKYCKKATEKQLNAITKARETAIKNRTCVKCNRIVGKKTDLQDGKCMWCIDEEIVLRNQEQIRLEFKDFLDNKDKYLILDTETTGLGNDDEIVEIAIIDMTGEALLHTKTYTEVPISPEASYINGIHNSDLINMPTIKELNGTINELFKNKTILIFNEDFDVRMLYQSGFEGDIKSKCLMNLYMNYVDSERWIGLQRAMDYEGIDIIQDHSALGDCLCCLELIKKIANK